MTDQSTPAPSAEGMVPTACLFIVGDSPEDAVSKGLVLQAVLQERRRQDDKWGSQRHLSNLMWNTILGEEVGEAAREVLEHDEAKLYAELTQVVAVGVVWMEALLAKRTS